MGGGQSWNTVDGTTPVPRPFGRRLIISTGIALLLANCVESDRKALEQVGGASCFSHALSREYLQLALVFHSGEFHRKSDAAAAGKSVTPLSPPPDEHVTTDNTELSLTEAATLLSSITAARDSVTGAPEAETNFPMELAHAQGRFDCWASSRSWLEDGRLRNTCRAEFERAACYISGRLDPASTDQSLRRKAGCEPASNPQTNAQTDDRPPRYWEC